MNWLLYTDKHVLHDTIDKEDSLGYQTHQGQGDNFMMSMCTNKIFTRQFNFENNYCQEILVINCSQHYIHACMT